MKIGMLVDTYLPIMGGAEIHVLELSRALSVLGFEIEVCTAVAAEGQAVDQEFPVLRLPDLFGGGWRAFLKIPFTLPRLVRFIRKVDFMHCHYSFLLAALGVVLGRMFGIPSAVTLHGLGTLDSSVDKHPLWRFYRYVSLKFAGTIIATSGEMREVALRFAPPERIVIIPNGVDTQKFHPREEPLKETGELIVLSMRRLAPKNGTQYLIEAAPQVVKALPQARFWISGEGKLEAYIRKRAVELGVDKHIRWLGIIPHSETWAYYQQADVVAFPSSAESTSLACLEAMSMQKAVVASALSAYKEMLGSNERGRLVSLFDRESSDYNAPTNLLPDRIGLLAEAIIELAQDARLREELGSKARAFVIERYDWRVIAQQTVDVYHRSGGPASG
ncbi:MAG: glycosyltransferase family 4 protein [Chloroflexi bacterium]|nr:glycosyltransferase family 4 protein [Chloroflexota bacterium]